MKISEQQLQIAEGSGDANKIKAAGWVRAVRAARAANARMAEGLAQLTYVENTFNGKIADLRLAVVSAEEILAPFQAKLDAARAALVPVEKERDSQVSSARATFAALRDEAAKADKAAAGLEGVDLD